MILQKTIPLFIGISSGSFNVSIFPLISPLLSFTPLSFRFVCTFLPFRFVCTFLSFRFVCTFLSFRFVCTFLHLLDLPSLFQGRDFKSYDHRHVQVTCLWDNDILHEDMCRPMYRLWNESSSRSNLLHALATEPRGISELNMRQIIGYIQANDMGAAMKVVLNERIRSSKIRVIQQHHSLYRELLFLSFAALGRENIDHGELNVVSF